MVPPEEELDDELLDKPEEDDPELLLEELLELEEEPEDEDELLEELLEEDELYDELDELDEDELLEELLEEDELDELDGNPEQVSFTASIPSLVPPLSCIFAYATSLDVIGKFIFNVFAGLGLGMLEFVLQ